MEQQAHVERIQRCRDSLHKLDCWIDANLKANGSWKQASRIEGYFSIVAYANYTGRRDWALAVLRYVQDTFPDSREVLRQGSHRDRMLGYLPAWMAVGAFDAEMFSLSNSLADYVATFQSAATGGFFANREARDTGAGPLEFDTTTMCIVALAHTGRRGPSLRGADYLVRLLEEQPNVTEGFNTDWVEPDGLVTPGESANPVAFIRWSQPAQHYYKIGLYVMSLIHAYGLSAERRYLDAALTVYNAAVERATHLWPNTISHKMCWAASVLHTVCGDDAYLEHAWRLAEHLLSVQQPDGTFNYPELWPTYPPEHWDMLPNAACQFGLWIARTLNALMAGDECRERDTR